MFKSYKKKNKGLTLLEIIIVLGIMGIIAAGVVLIAQRAIDNQNIQRLTTQLNMIQTAMIQVYRSSSSYPVVGKDVTQSKKLRDALVLMGKVNKQDFQNPFTGLPVEIFTTSLNKVPNRTFAIYVKELSQDQCASLIMNAQSQFEFIQVAATGPISLVADAWVNASANTSLGVIKSLNGLGVQFNIEDLDQVNALCGGVAGQHAFYDVYLGNR